MSKSTYTGPKTPGKRLTTEEFIRRARLVHGNRYDYSMIDYINAGVKVIIICPTHGEFKQSPAAHCKGRGCPKCSGNIKLTTKEFIKLASVVHGNRYDYSKVIYKGAHCKVSIICPIHGEFLISAYSHSRGRGCNICAGNKKLTTKQFISLAKKVHGSKYDYSKVEYKNANTKVIIICPIHGEFEQRPSSHLNSHGCCVCAGLSKLTTEEFIERAKKIHGNRYDYSKVDYKNNGTKVIIICPIHGEFKQTPHSHLTGKSGCPICNKNLNRSADPHPGFLYFITCKTTNESFCKIGTAYDTKKRFRLFPFEITTSLIIPGIIGPLSIIEEQIKKDFKTQQYIPNVRFGGSTECFRISAHKKIQEIILQNIPPD